MIVYQVCPIYDWSGWHDPRELFRVRVRIFEDFGLFSNQWDRAWEQALELGKEAGWEGDIREGPFVSVLPEPPGSYSAVPFLIAWKQDNNGTTFIASPYELPWILNECECSAWESE